MNIPLPGHILLKEEWNVYIREHVPALETLWQQGKFEQFEAYKELAGLSHEAYLETLSNDISYTMPLIRKAIPQMLSSEIASVQPMSEPTGEVQTLKSKKKSQEKH